MSYFITEVKVTGCHNCPFNYGNVCKKDGDTEENYFDVRDSCPMSAKQVNISTSERIDNET